MKANILPRRRTHEQSGSAHGHPRDERYTPPTHELTRILTLDDLISGIRNVTPEQQSRFHSDNRLWCVGDTSLLRQKCVAIVGTRQVSAGGASRSRLLARELASACFLVVWGLAKGSVTEALKSAIRSAWRLDS